MSADVLIRAGVSVEDCTVYRLDHRRAHVPRDSVRKSRESRIVFDAVDAVNGASSGGDFRHRDGVRPLSRVLFTSALDGGSTCRRRRGTMRHPERREGK